MALQNRVFFVYMTYTDIKNEVYLLTKTNSTSLPDASMVLYANTAYDRVVSLIMESDGRWQFDDTNQTDLPIATTALVSGQTDYELSTAHLAVSRVEVKKTDGKWVLLKPIDPANITVAMNEFMNVSGDPMYYDKSGNSLFLYPASNYSQAASLKVYFQRPPSYFVSGDTTKVPGFKTIYHELIPLWISYKYALANSRNNATTIFNAIQLIEKSLKKDYASRAKDEVVRSLPKKENYN